MLKHVLKIFQSKWFACALLVLGAAGVGVVSLAFATTANRWDMMDSYFKRPLLIFLNLLPGVLISLFIWFLCNRPVVAYGISSLLVFGFTLANWYKLQFRNDPLMFGDLFLAKEAGNMLSRYALFVTPALLTAIIMIAAGGVLVFFCAKGRFKPGYKRFIFAGAMLLLSIPCAFLYTNDYVYDKSTRNDDHINRWSATQVYTSKGFVYPFLYSVSAAFPSPPQEYSEKEAQAILSEYEDKDIPQEQKVDIICVMLEAYNDFSKYEQIRFEQDVYEKYHALEREAYTGNLITSIFAGGTVTTERSFVTGYSDLGAFRGKTNSYAWYLDGQGYTVTGSHPCYEWFYNRLNINPNLGFSTYYFQENHYGALAPEGTIAKDEIVFPEIKKFHDLAKAESDAPYFSFSVTYQGHGPYNTEENQWGESYVTPGAYTQESENILNNYFGSIKSTGDEIDKFIQSYRDSQEPVVIVLFGDHNPWLGDGNSVYKELGIDLDNGDIEGFMNYYSTRYLFWANDSAKKVLGEDFVGKGPDISPNYLMSQLFTLCGWDGPAFMQYSRSLMEEYPVIQGDGAYIDNDGLLHNNSQQESENLLENLRVEYYMKENFLY